MTGWVKAGRFERVRIVALAASSATCFMLCGQGFGWAQGADNLLNPTRSMSVEATPVVPTGSSNGENPVAPTRNGTGETPIAPAGSLAEENPIAPTRNVAGENPAVPAGNVTGENPVVPTGSGARETPVAPTGNVAGENPAVPAGNVAGENPAVPDKDAGANPNPATAEQWPELPPLEAAAYLPDAKARVRLELRLGERRVYLYEDEKVTASYPVAIGKSSTPTPTGEFKVFQLIENPIWKNPWTGEVTAPGANSALGLRWIGFAEMSNGIIGFHGTPTVASIGKAASNGCVRMYNEDVVALFSRVEMGTPVTVVR